MTPDVIIIGSGFGGAFAADMLVRAGLRVTLVERGPWRDTRPVRAAGIRERSPLPRGRHAATRLLRQVSAPFLPGAGVPLHAHGLFDLHLERDMTVVCSSGVGGGSHVYASMNTRPAVATLWDGHAAGVDATTLAPRYDAAIARMGARVPGPGRGIPNFTGERFAQHPLLRGSAQVEQPAMGFRFDAGQWQRNSFLGSPDGGKVTLDELLVAPAMARGLAVLDLHEAVDIGRGSAGWRVTLRDHRHGGFRHLQAPRLLLAAGTLNTLRLLFAARARGNLGALPGLGQGFGGNGDVIGYWACNEAGADLRRGAPCHGRLALPGQDPADMLTALGLDGLDDLPLPASLRRRFRRDLLLVAMGADAANGIARWQRGRLRLAYDAATNPVLGRIANTLDQLAQGSGKPVYFPRTLPVTVHPLGGARVADDPRRGVVNGLGEVHGHDGLHIVDASALPGAPGTPPSMSIAAWALHVSHHIASHG